jgi:hypothetical protein
MIERDKAGGLLNLERKTNKIQDLVVVIEPTSLPCRIITPP